MKKLPKLKLKAFNYPKDEVLRSFDDLSVRISKNLGVEFSFNNAISNDRVQEMKDRLQQRLQETAKSNQQIISKSQLNIEWQPDEQWNKKLTRDN